MLKFLDDGGGSCDACFMLSDEPASIWTTCLKVEVSAWTKVVGMERKHELEIQRNQILIVYPKDCMLMFL